MYSELQVICSVMFSWDLSYKYILVFIVQALGQRISKRAKKQNPDWKKEHQLMAASRLLHQKFYFLVIVNRLTFLDLILTQHAQDVEYEWTYSTKEQDCELRKTEISKWKMKTFSAFQHTRPALYPSFKDKALAIFYLTKSLSWQKRQSDEQLSFCSDPTKELVEVFNKRERKLRQWPETLPLNW